MDFRTRSQEKEIMDFAPLTLEESRRVYPLIAGVNRYLGGVRVILKHLSRFSKKWKRGEKIRILDVGSGRADIPQAIADWCRKRNQPVQITALDLRFEALESARGLEDYPEIKSVQASCFKLPFSENAYDYVIASLFFHHLSDLETVEALKSFDRIAKRGIIINDLVRSRRAYWGIKLLAIFSGNKIFKNDAPLSVLRGFVQREAEDLIRRSGLSYLSFFRHYAYRFALAGEKHV